MPRHKGSAAVARKAAPRSAAAEKVRVVASRLHRISSLALLAADGPEPEEGALYILEALEDLAPRLRALDRMSRRYR